MAVEPSSEHVRSVEAVWRIESAHVLATLARVTGDLASAEDLAHDALVAALEQWPARGVPSNPRAWLITVARRRFLDSLRRKYTFEAKRPELARDAAQYERTLEAELDAAAEEVPDDLLRLIFLCCHPLLSRDAQVGLTLQMVAGLTAEQIARAFLLPAPTVAQRLVRAKRTLAAARVEFELPRADALRERLDAVLEVLYLVFNEGYVSSAGEDWTRPDLCFEALRVGRVLAGLQPDESEVHGLVALMELQASRLRARTDAQGAPVLLADQDRSRWDRLLVRRGLDALDRAARTGGGLGRFGLQAAIASCHATAPSLVETDWVQIAALYEALGTIAPSPVVDLNRAVALSMAYGPEAGFEIVESLMGEPSLSEYHLLWSVRADLLSRLGRHEEARSDLERARALTRNADEQELLARRARAAEQAGEEAAAGASEGSPPERLPYRPR